MPFRPATARSITADAGLDGDEGDTLAAIERRAIVAAITRSGGSLPLAARSLGISPSTHYRERERWAQS